ncbi:MAG: adenylate/guanylate cyclase with CHASE sensor, partial [uncultured bacterium]
ADCEGAEPAAVRSCSTALTIMQETAELNARLAEQGLPNIIIGAGIATGEVISGRIGSHSGRRDYTVIGDRVNLAARLEAMSHFSDQMHILADLQTMQTATARFGFKSHGELPVKGKASLVQVYELFESNN